MMSQALLVLHWDPCQNILYPGVWMKYRYEVDVVTGRQVIPVE